MPTKSESRETRARNSGQKRVREPDRAKALSCFDQAHAYVYTYGILSSPRGWRRCDRLRILLSRFDRSFNELTNCKPEAHNGEILTCWRQPEAPG